MSWRGRPAGTANLIAVLVLPLNTYLFTRREQGSVFAPPARVPLDWNLTIMQGVNALLAFAIAYLLLRWLYLTEEDAPVEQGAEAAGE